MKILLYTLTWGLKIFRTFFIHLSLKQINDLSMLHNHALKNIYTMDQTDNAHQ